MKIKTTVVIAIAISLLCSTMLFGQADIGFKGVGGKLGFIDPGGGIGSTISLGGVADLGTIIPKIALEASITYWGKSWDVIGADWKTTCITIAAIGKYYFSEPDQQLRPFAGAGLGLNYSSFSYDTPVFNQQTGTWGTDEKTDSDADIGLHMVGGANYRLSDSMDGFAEFRWVNGGDWDYWGIYAGVIFNLNK